MAIVSVCTVTLNRPHLILECLGTALEKANYPLEFLTWDNGSIDPRTIEYMTALRPTWQHNHPENIGYAQACNQMLLRSSGDYICILDPDIKLPDNWLARLVEVAEKIPNTGLSGWHCIEAFPVGKMINGIKIYEGDVFGVKFYPRQVIETIGYYFEGYGRYGLEDRDFLLRIKKKGFLTYYVGNGSIHAGDDVGDVSDYRKMKWEALKVAYPVLLERTELYNNEANCYVPPPALMELENDDCEITELAKD